MVSKYELDNIDKRADLEIFGIYTVALFMYKIKHKRQPAALKKKQREAYERAASHLRLGEMITMRINMNRLPNGKPDFKNLGIQFEARIEPMKRYGYYDYDEDDDDEDDEIF